jgi:hypothetical protein
MNLGTPVPKRDRGALDPRCSCTSKLGSHSFSPLQPSSHVLLDKASPNSSSNIDFIEASADRVERFGRGEVDLERNFGAQDASRRIWIDSEKDEVYGGALRVASAPADEYTDAVSLTASSTVLDPARMPRIIGGETITGEDTDRGSLETGSGYSVEADEMIELRSQHSERDTWKILRDAWHKARSKRRWTGQKAVPPRFSFNT